MKSLPLFHMLVSVYIPTKNRLKLLERAINSVKNQTYKNIEIIVVDDGSSDGTHEYLSSEMSSGTLKAIFHNKSLGACVSRNEAIIAAKGEFITGLDDDDFFSSNKRIEYFISRWSLISEKAAGLFDSSILSKKSGEKKLHEKEIVTHKNLREFNAIGNQIFAPKSHFIEGGLFDPSMPAWQDWDLWLRISEKFGNFLNINRYSYFVDEMHDADRITIQDQKKIREAMNRLSNKIENLSLREKSSLTISMLAYPQVQPKFNEIGTLLIAMRLRSFFYATRKILS